VIDAILLARDAFPRVYGETAFNYDAMLAFLCRWGLISKSFVLSHQRRLRRYHPFNPVRFVAYATFFDAAALRRRVLNWVASRGPLATDVPGNVHEFARRYDRWRRGRAVLDPGRP
jgi:hypothetical protein